MASLFEGGCGAFLYVPFEEPTGGSLPAAFSSSFGGLPEPFFGARESLRRAFLA
jgi:hypothetical protein